MDFDMTESEYKNWAESEDVETKIFIATNISGPQFMLKLLNNPSKPLNVLMYLSVNSDSVVRRIAEQNYRKAQYLI